MTKLDLKIPAFAIAALLILGYAYHGTRNLIEGPRVTLTMPLDGATVTSSLAKIEGAAKNSVLVTLNGRVIFTNEVGEFRDELLLAPGYNTLEVYVEDRFGRAVTEKIEVVRK